MASQTVAHAGSNVVTVAFGNAPRTSTSRLASRGGRGTVVAFHPRVDLEGLYAWVFRDCKAAGGAYEWERFKEKRQEPEALAQFAAIERHYGYRPGKPFIA